MLGRGVDTAWGVGADEQIGKFSFLSPVTFFTCQEEVDSFVLSKRANTSCSTG